MQLRGGYNGVVNHCGQKTPTFSNKFEMKIWAMCQGSVQQHSFVCSSTPASFLSRSDAWLDQPASKVGTAGSQASVALSLTDLLAGAVVTVISVFCKVISFSYVQFHF